ncbi:MAG: NmrA/HSCARG family protein [Gemmatimonadetes bacterium]|nr:NmrA/HSCARG family protein [Gemmatimonadota bacterium]
MSNGQNERTILVTGATGQQGGAVAQHLLQNGFQVRALTRSPDKPAAGKLRDQGSEIVEGDLDDRASLDRALEGAYGVFSVQNFWETGYQREIDQGVRLANAAKDAGVEHFVYSSVGSAHRNTGLSHFESKWEIENHIRDIGLPHTIFRPVFFMDNWENAFLRNPILSGTLAQPLDPDTPFQQVAVDDIGAFVAMAFRDRDRWLGRELDLAGDDGTISEAAATFGRAIGRPVQYQQVPWEDYRKAAGEEYYKMYRWFQDVGYNADVQALRGEYPALTDFEAYLRRNGWEGAQPAEQAE